MNAVNAEKTKLWGRDFALVLLVALFCSITGQGLNNGLPIYVAENGAPNIFAGWLILDFSMAAAAARIFIGGRIDGSSRRRIMQAGALFLAVGSFGAVAFPVLEAHIVYRAIQGIGFGLCTTATPTAAADIAPVSRLGEALGLAGLGQSIGMVIGPSLGIALVGISFAQSPFGPATLFFGLGFVALLLFLFATFCTYEQHPQRLDPTCAFRLGHSEAEVRAEELANYNWFTRSFEIAALPGALPMTVICLAYSIITNFVSKYAVEQGFDVPGSFFIVSAITMTLVRLLAGRLIDNVSPRALVVVPVLSGAASFLCLLYWTSGLGFWLAGALFGLSLGLAVPLFNTQAVRCSPLDRRGAATALFFLGNDIGVGAGAVIGGLVIDAFGYEIAFWEGVVVFALAYLVAAIVFPRKKSPLNS